MADAGVGLEACRDVELDQCLREARSALEPRGAADRVPFAHDVGRVRVCIADADQRTHVAQRRGVEGMLVIPECEVAHAVGVRLRARGHRVRARGEGSECGDPIRMAKSEPVRALRTARKADHVDRRGDMEARGGRHLVHQRDERLVDA